MSRARALQRLDRLEGWSATKTRRNHWRITGPGGLLVFTGSTPSDRCALRNLLSDLGRAGAPQVVLDIVRSA